MGVARLMINYILGLVDLECDIMILKNDYMTWHVRTHL